MLLQRTGAEDCIVPVFPRSEKQRTPSPAPVRAETARFSGVLPAVDPALSMKILVLSDIHGNYPALAAVAAAVRDTRIQVVCNCGDSTVYAPFPNETLAWLRAQGAISIRGNTDDRIVRLIRGKTLKKPRHPEKRRMYTSTWAALDDTGKDYLLALRKRADLEVAGWRIGLFHGSPEDHEEFLHSHTPWQRFEELARNSRHDLVICGHSHSPYHKYIHGVHFLNPGSVGRMLDGDPRAAYAILELGGPGPGGIRVELHRQEYDIEQVVTELIRQELPAIYIDMFRQGRKLN